MLKIAPVFDPLLNCYENLIATVCEFWEIDHKYLYSGSWGFHHNFNQTQYELRKDIERSQFSFHTSHMMQESYVSLGYRIHPLPFFHHLESYLGLGIQAERTRSTSHVVALSEEYTSSGTPLGITFDGFWCPWHPMYQKREIEHFVLVSGLTPDGLLIIVDPMFPVDVQFVNPVELEHQACIDVIKFSKRGPGEMDWLDVLSVCLANIRSTDSIVSMRAFAHELEHSNDIACEFSLFPNFELHELFIQLRMIHNNRLRFSIYLAWLAEQHRIPELAEMSRLILSSAEQWDVIKNAFVKASFLKDPQPAVKKLSWRVLEAARLEDAAADELERIVHGDRR
ncbi:hypothetical protein [Cohnella soli]|uniref:Butirosin biosynthesis protein H N-terminal domain-containing protein n=1 Tax=Cohnella soli TaxID=425005 RepID=A0ABW0I7V5_9BACL